MNTYLNALSFVRGAVSTKDFNPILAHYQIQGGRVWAYNGSILLSSPVQGLPDCTPEAEKLYRALSSCETDPEITLSKAGRLKVKAGKFTTFVECAVEDVPDFPTEGAVLDLTGKDLLALCRLLAPFISTDATRPWSMGILFTPDHAYATNNVIVIERVFETGSIPVVLPARAVQEILRIGQNPTHAQVTERSVTFHYAGGAYLHTNLIDAKWPDMTKILDRPNTPKPIPDTLFKGVELLKPFCDDLSRIYFHSEGVHTKNEQGDEYSSYHVPDLTETALFNVGVLALLKGVATHADFSMYPAPAPFYGDHIRGAIVGMRN